MPALDTDLPVRHAVQDDNRQLAAAMRLIGRRVAEGQSLHVPLTAALELEWVLRAGSGYAKDEVLQVRSNLLSAAELSFEAEWAVGVGDGSGAAEVLGAQMKAAPLARDAGPISTPLRECQAAGERWGDVPTQLALAETHLAQAEGAAA